MIAKQRYPIIISYLAIMIIAGIFWPGEESFFIGYSKILTEPSMLISDYFVIALFGTALGPVISVMTFSLSINYWVSSAVGILLGMILPSLASHVLHNHQGFSLYNVGFTCGIIGVFVTAFLKSQGFLVETTMIWGTLDQKALALFFTLYFATMVVLGWSGRSHMKSLWRLTGTLPTDFVSEHSFPAALLNMGLVGLIGMAYIALVRGDFNGESTETYSWNC